MLADLPSDQLPYVLAGIAGIASAFFIYFMKKDIHKFALIGFALMLGGALGNMIDRFRFGAVVDFIHVYYDKWHFPAFNVADTCISVGVAFIILDAIVEFRVERKERKMKKCK
jgi:signal peptidase II